MNTKFFLNTFNAIETVVNGAVRTVMNVFTFIITEMAPMVAPLPPAFSVYTAMTERLGVPVYVGVVGAIAIEIVGMFSSKVSIRCYQWNKGRNKSDPIMPQPLSVIMTAAYFIVVLMLALTVELLPGLVALVIPGFVLIAISVYVNLAIHTNLEKLEMDRAATVEAREEKNGLAAQIRQAKRELEIINQKTQNETQKLQNLRAKNAVWQQNQKTQNETQMDANGPFAGDNAAKSANLEAANSRKKAQIERRRSEVLQHLQTGKNAPEIAELVGVSADTVRRDIKKLNGRAK